MPASERQKELTQQLIDYASAYYEQDAPYISDAEYDTLYDELEALEQESGEVLPNSPTRRVGGEAIRGFLPYRHTARLWSLDKVRTEAALLEWDARIQKLRLEYMQRTGQELPASVTRWNTNSMISIFFKQKLQRMCVIE